MDIFTGFDPNTGSSNFLTDNLLLSEDWDGNFDDLNGLLTNDLDGDSDSPTFPDNARFIQLPVDDDNMNLFGGSAYTADQSWRDLSDGSDSGIDCIQMKTEPVSPSSYFSDTSSDASNYGLPCLSPSGVEYTNITSATELSTSQWGELTEAFFVNDSDIKPETVETFPLSTSSSSNTLYSSSFFSSIPSDAAVDMHGLDDVTFVADESGSLIGEIPSAGGATGQSITTAVTLNVPSKKTIILSNVVSGGAMRSAGTVKPMGRSAVVKVDSAVKIQPKIVNTQDAGSLMNIRTPVSCGATHNKLIIVNQPQSSIVTSSDSSAQPTLKQSASMPSVPSLPLAGNLDIKVVKRHQRMIKNRESACLSRKRKKEYLLTLEQQMQAYNDENDRLRTENLLLKRKVDSLLNENSLLKKARPITMKTGGATVLLVVLVFMTFNWTPFFSLMSSSFSQSVRDIPSTHHGRALLSLREDSSEEGLLPTSLIREEVLPESLRWNETWSSNQTDLTDDVAAWKDIRDLMLFKKLSDSSSLGKLMCPSYLNSTESLRLINELRGWVMGHEEERKRQRVVLNMEEQKKAKTQKKYYAPNKIRAAMKRPVEKYVHISDKYEMQLFNSMKREYDDFINALQRRNDTFYVVSFRHDHLLLPATAHNKTMRPLMSVMMPAIGLNETMQPPMGSVAMMQIDCEVTATRLIHIDKSAIPDHLFENTTTSGQRHRQRQDKHTHDFTHLPVDKRP